MRTSAHGHPHTFSEYIYNSTTFIRKQLKNSNIKSKGKSVNYKKNNTFKRYKVGISGTTVPLSERYSADSCFGFLVPYYFQIFKAWAMVSHSSLREWRESVMPQLYKNTFQSYCNASFRVVSINRLFLYFSYFRYNKDICDRLLSEGCDITSLDFWQFLQLQDIPLPYGERLSVPIIWDNLIPRKYIQLPDNQ